MYGEIYLINQPAVLGLTLVEPDLILVDIVYHFVLELDMDLADLANLGFTIFSHVRSIDQVVVPA